MTSQMVFNVLYGMSNDKTNDATAVYTMVDKKVSTRSDIGTTTSGNIERGTADEHPKQFALGSKYFCLIFH